MGQQNSAGQGDIAAGSSSNAAVGSGESGLVAEEALPNFHLPAHLDVSDGSGVSPAPLLPIIVVFSHGEAHG